MKPPIVRPRPSPQEVPIVYRDRRPTDCTPAEFDNGARQHPKEAYKPNNLQKHQIRQSFKDVGKLSFEAKSIFFAFMTLGQARVALNELLTFTLKTVDASQEDVDKMKEAWRLIDEVYHNYGDMLGVDKTPTTSQVILATSKLPK